MNVSIESPCSEDSKMQIASAIRYNTNFQWQWEYEVQHDRAGKWNLVYGLVGKEEEYRTMLWEGYTPQVGCIEKNDQLNGSMDCASILQFNRLWSWINGNAFYWNELLNCY